MFASRFWQTCTRYLATFQVWTSQQQQPLQSNATSLFPEFAFSEDWEVLGPFQIGTREAIWGADPLEYHGGFRALECNDSASFRSPLAFNGTVQWSKTKAKVSPPSSAFPYRNHAELNVAFPDIDWAILQDVYGWPALQWQAWVRGEIQVRSSGPKAQALHVDKILEFWIDGRHYFGGDFYGYQRAAVALRLEPGVHRIDVRLVRDVRAMGGVGVPTVEAKLALESTSEGLTVIRPENARPYAYAGVTISDIIGGDFGPLATPYASVIVRNDGMEDVLLDGIEGTRNQCETEIVGDPPFLVGAGQTRPVCRFHDSASCASFAMHL
jgi:hypothetical protein